MLRLLRYCRRYRGSMLVVAAAAALGMGALAVVPLLERSIVDDAVSHAGRARWPLIIALVALALFVFGASCLRRSRGGRLALDLQHDLRTDIFAALSRLDGLGQDRLEIGNVMSRANADVAMTQVLVTSVPLAVGSLVLFAVSLVAMLVLSPLLTLVALVVAPLMWWIGERGRGTIFPATWDSQQQAATVAGVIDDAVAGVRVVKGFGQEAQEEAKLAAAARRLYASRLRALRLGSWYKAQLRAIPVLGQVAVLAIGGLLALRGDITLGTFAAFWAYLAQLAGPIQSLTRAVALGQQARAGSDRIFEIIDARPDVADAPGATALPAGAAGELRLDGVTFGYLPSRPVLHGLSLHVRPGETMALIGATGSGKSTVSLLLPRFYDVGEGSVRVAGHDVRNLTLDSLRAQIGLVLEESFLFAETIRANIAFGRPGAGHEQVVAAARAAEAHEFVQALPDGYDTVVGEGGLTLSGGQRQRIALARALLTDPPVLILDDATSAVDAQVSEALHRTLRRVLRGRTALLIAHHRATLELADRVAVLDRGHLVDVGTPAELEVRCARYRLLVSGPGDDAEGRDAGELPVAPERSPWDPEQAPEPIARTAGGQSGGPAGVFALMAASDRMLAQVAALPPALDVPGVDERAARADAGRPHLTALLRPFALGVAGVLALVVLDALASLVLPLLTRYGIDHGIARDAPAVVGWLSAVAAVVVLADMVAVRAHVLLTGRIGERVLYALRLRMFAHLQRLGLDYYQGQRAGQLLTRMTADPDVVANFVQDGLTATVVGVLTLGGILIALLVLSPILGLVTVAALPVAVLATLVFRRVSSRAYADAREKAGAVNADLREGVAGLRVTQAYRREAHNRGLFTQRSDAYRASRARAQQAAAVYFPFLELLSLLVAAGVLVIGSHLVHDGVLTAGALIAYLIYIDLFFAPLQQLSQVFDGYQQAAVGLRRIVELLGTPSSTPEPADPVAVPHRLRGDIRFTAVRFRYAPDTPEALRGIDLHIRPGETVALVGATGAGKSTLAKLLFRFYDATEGTVRVDGVDLRDFALAGYRHRLALVPQEPYLFPGTVRDVIAYGRPAAGRAEVEAAARAAGAHEMIRHLDGGYLHPVAERGRNLSAGQRQLLALARAELPAPDILVMDEPTAALDRITETAVARAAAGSAALPGAPARTTVVIAHRLTTASRADRIAVLDEGRIVELGTHEELLAAGRHYPRMWRAFTGVPLPLDVGPAHP